MIEPIAFPSAVQPGMTLRDYFAGQVLAGDLEQGTRDSADYVYWHEPSVIAKRAYEIADAMLQARRKK